MFKYLTEKKKKKHKSMSSDFSKKINYNLESSFSKKNVAIQIQVWKCYSNSVGVIEIKAEVSVLAVLNLKIKLEHLITSMN